MRSRPIQTLVALTGVAALAAGGASTFAANPSAAKRVRCTIELVVAIPPGAMAPNPAATSGDHFGSVSCGQPFGAGVQADAYKATPSSATSGKVSGPFKQFFGAGTIRGRYAMTYTATSATSLTYSGTYTVVRGTGAYAQARGRGKLSCSSPDGGVHVNCRARLTLSRT